MREDVLVVVPGRAKTARYCSNACRGAARATQIRGAANPGWIGGEREKVCLQCGKVFKLPEGGNIRTFVKQKFCSKKCADIGGIRYQGAEHPRYSSESRHHHRPKEYNRWQKLVISRDAATCQKCGAKEVELHAHHLKSYRDFPDLRFDVANGVTLCYRCHWAEHQLIDVEEFAAEVGADPATIDGSASANGRPIRRITTKCAWCGVPVSRALGHAKGKKNLFCSLSCAAKHRMAERKARKGV